MVADVFAVCASIPDPYDREQITCGLGLPDGRVANAGSVSIKRVTAMAKSSITLDGGVYCVRPCVFGNGQVSILVEHP